LQDAQTAGRDHKSNRGRPEQIRFGAWALRRSPRADPDRLRSRLVPAGRFENRHTPGGLGVAPTRLGFDLRSLACLVAHLL
jgi:hypothetical protein